MYLGDRASVAEAVREFLGIDRTPIVPESMLTTVLFTDIVGSTQRAAELGDIAWKELLGNHDQVASKQIDRFRGRYVHTTGDGLLATFDGPARAVRCARAIVEAVRALGLEIRAGCHTGEVELAGDDIQGITVHVGARIAALAGPGDPRFLDREGSDAGERPHVRRRRGTRSEGCSRPLAPLPGGELMGFPGPVTRDARQRLHRVQGARRWPERDLDRRLHRDEHRAVLRVRVGSRVMAGARVGLSAQPPRSARYGIVRRHGRTPRSRDPCRGPACGP